MPSLFPSVRTTLCAAYPCYMQHLHISHFAVRLLAIRFKTGPDSDCSQVTLILLSKVPTEQEGVELKQYGKEKLQSAVWK